jgi:TPR repeat protein
MTTNPADCWKEVYRLISKRKFDQAMAMCEREPYAAVMECQSFLGWEYYDRGDLTSAYNWFFKAIEQGDVEAIFGMGCVYWVARDGAEAAYYFQEALDRGYARAAYWLYCLYYYGNGVPKDEIKALQLLQYSADQGILVAQEILRRMTYSNGGSKAKIMLFLGKIQFFFRMLWYALPNAYDPRVQDLPTTIAKYRRDNLPQGKWIWAH